jgi:hypothetical protein
MSDKRVPDIITFIFISAMAFYFTGSAIHYGLFSGIAISYEIKFASTFAACMISLIFAFKDGFFVKKEETLFNLIRRDVVKDIKIIYNKLI